MNLNNSGPIAGTQTVTYTTLTAGTFFLECRSTFIAPSGTTLTISQTGSASNSYSNGPALPNQTHIEISNTFQCAAGDVLTLSITSSNVNDSNGVNRLESVYRLSESR